MLELLLTPSDGGTAYRHLLAPGEARAGFECVGPFGLARRLGRVLGVATDAAPAPDRLAAWARRLDAHEDGHRSYSESRRNDPWGVASHLLGLRDRLRLAGWAGGPLAGSARLADLAALERLEPELPPGHPEILAALATEVRARPFPIPLRIGIAATRSPPRAPCSSTSPQRRLRPATAISAACSARSSTRACRRRRSPATARSSSSRPTRRSRPPSCS